MTEDVYLSALCSVCSSEFGDHKSKTLQCPFPEKGRKRNEFALDIKVNGQRKTIHKPCLDFIDLIEISEWKDSRLAQGAEIQELWIRCHHYVGSYKKETSPLKISHGLNITIEIASLEG